jgi:hypothetical protein
MDYCKYSDWGYKKPTRIWTNKVGFIPKTCNKDCVSINNGKHIISIGNTSWVRLNDKYRIPPSLITDLIS